MNRSIDEISKTYQPFRENNTQIRFSFVADVLYLLDIITRLVGIIRMLSIGDDWERRVARAKEILIEMEVKL